MDLFEQQSSESPKAFAAFEAYRALGPQRSLRKVCAQLGRCRSLIARWAHDHHWEERVKEYEAHTRAMEVAAVAAQVESRAKAWLDRREEHREAEWQLRADLMRAAQRALGQWQHTTRSANLGEVTRALELVSKLGRLATGMATDTMEHTGEVDLTLRVDAEAAVRKAYGVIVEVEPALELSDRAPSRDGHLASGAGGEQKSTTDHGGI